MKTMYNYDEFSKLENLLLQKSKENWIQGKRDNQFNVSDKRRKINWNN